ncbi:histone-like DNA binding protein (plasmid) [Streptomyces alboflavus]|uniref:Histone-like DNA binding protein n=1 Tax=Streptomyces alboflavus TaxID=67267 RepID=A0A291W4P5_9ACTN|nr:HU family DNA-binding protein [Streptomyces alboflavus]ATM24522.1 histone-like DNA binding protein [Streptomyces alboflavus]
MNKQQLIEQMAANGGVTRAQAAHSLDLVLDTLVREVIDGNDVSVTGFGKLAAVRTHARRGRNPQTGEPILVPASKRIKFTPGSAFTAMARGTRPVPVGRSAASKRPKTADNG